MNFVMVHNMPAVIKAPAKPSFSMVPPRGHPSAAAPAGAAFLDGDVPCDFAGGDFISGDLANADLANADLATQDTLEPVRPATTQAGAAGPDAVPPRQSRRLQEAVGLVGAANAAKPAEEASDPQNRRWAARKRTETPGYIGHAKNPQGVRCIVRDTSSSGALVEVCSGSDRYSNPADEVPDRLTLVFISYKERTEVACAVMRRSGRMLGVRYVGPFRSYPAPAASTKMASNLKKR